MNGFSLALIKSVSSWHPGLLGLLLKLSVVGAGALLAEASAAQTIDSPIDGHAEQSISAWRTGLFAAIRDAVALVPEDRRHASVGAIGLSFQRESFTLVSPPDEDQTELVPLRPAILWLDGRADSECEAIKQAGSAATVTTTRYHDLTGKPLDVTSAMARMQWLAKHEPSLVCKPHHWVDCGAVLAHALTGNLTTCVAGCDTAGLIDLSQRQWSLPILEAAGLTPEQMPQLAEPGELLGGVSAAAAAELGGLVPVGCPVVAAGGDGQVFNVGMSAGVGLGAGGMMLTLGTSVVLSVESTSASIAPAYRTLAAADGVNYTLETVVQSGTLILKWFVDEFGAGDNFDDLERAARDLPPGAEGLMTVPHFWGCRFPDSRPSLRGATLGWSHAHSRAHLYRSIMEGLCLELRRAADYMPDTQNTTVYVGGGGADSDLLLSILANCMNRPVEAKGQESGSGESVAFGAALLAGRGAGLIDKFENGNSEPSGEARRVFLPDPECAAVYEELYTRVYLPLLDAATPLSEELSAIAAKAASLR